MEMNYYMSKVVFSFQNAFLSLGSEMIQRRQINVPNMSLGSTGMMTHWKELETRTKVGRPEVSSWIYHLLLPAPVQAV